MEALKPHLQGGVPIVGLEPSCLLTFRDEYQAMFPGDAMAGKLAGAQLADEYLAAAIASGRIQPPWRKSPGRLKVHGHCHQKAFGTFDATLALLRTLPDTTVEPIESGCCGMAGSFGHEHYEVSMKMGELGLLPAVRASAGATIVAAGTSCRQQVAHGAQREAKHPLVVLAECL
jgi:Fe-S oxidoreductase